MTLLLRAARLGLGAALAALATPACYPEGGNGTAPPTDSLYFPTGLALSAGGNVLYAINSDFDLQWNGGTLQSYDLFQIRQDAAGLIQSNLAGSSPPPDIPFVTPWTPGCPGNTATPANNGVGLGVLLGTQCAPPVDSTAYVRDSATIGAFATDLQLALDGGTRLFAPVSGNATVTWADVAYDDPGGPPPQPTDTASTFAPFSMDCGVRSQGRCDAAHQTGNDPNAAGDTRNVTIPGEPFGLAQSADGTAMALTSETETEASLLTTGLQPPSSASNFANACGNPPCPPVMQYVLTGMPNGGVGLASVPHDANAGIPLCEDTGDQAGCLRQAFLETNRSSAEVDLLRYYDDDGSSLHRPYIQKEAVFPINTNVPGTDSRGIAIDYTQRIACEAQPGADLQQCARLPARVFIASRSPASLIIGQLGQPTPPGEGAYNPDQLFLLGNVPMTAGPSKVYLAPIVMPDADGFGHYVLRVFVVCFDSNSIFVYDPDQLMSLNAQPEFIIVTGLGPYAMAFDPFSWQDVATNAVVPLDSRQPAGLGLKRYRFAYLASFTRSYMQMVDLDDSLPTADTFYSVVFTLGTPTPPKGT
jgi:hypothetical protein